MTDGRHPPLAALFPVGGRLSPEQMVGREGDVADLVQRLAEFAHIVLSGPRRTGKTSVCAAACAVLRDEHDFLIIELETPEQSSAAGVCQLVIDRAARLDLDRISRGLLRAVTPVVQKLLADRGLPLDLSQFGADIPDAGRRAVLELPLEIARQRERKAVFFIDELQRAVNYSDGIALVRDIVDVYSASTDVVVLVDGSDRRTVEALMGAPYGLARLGQRLELPPTIPTDQWRGPLSERFERAGLPISDERLERILAFGVERPYATMAACLYVAVNARRLEIQSIDDFAVDRGLEEARARLDEDG